MRTRSAAASDVGGLGLAGDFRMLLDGGTLFAQRAGDGRAGTHLGERCIDDEEDRPVVARRPQCGGMVGDLFHLAGPEDERRNGAEPKRLGRKNIERVFGRHLAAFRGRTDGLTVRVSGA